VIGAIGGPTGCCVGPRAEHGEEGDLLHIAAIYPGVLFEDARRPCNRSFYLVGVFGHGTGPPPFRAAAHRADSGRERPLTPDAAPAAQNHLKAPLPDAMIDISQHAFRSVREYSVVVIGVPKINGAESDQSSQE
jgi:hypothetical protein